ncbi:MAG: hypothetical protein P8X82_07525 [Gemmatimonadales bacterium]|jgi:hypothetical protein
MCPECDDYAVDLDIYGPAQLRRVVGKIQAAISEQRLRSDDERMMGQPPLAELDLSQLTPDAMTYYVVCDSCGQTFRLQCESYHGSGGNWRCV